MDGICFLPLDLALLSKFRVSCRKYCNFMLCRFLSIASQCSKLVFVDLSFILFLFPHETQGLFSWILVFIRVSDEHIRLKCGIDALQYIVFQKHLLVYTVIIFCLSIGIILPVNYSGTNGEKQSRGGGGEGYSRFQVTGVIEGVFGFEIFNWGIFLGRKIWQVVFEVACFKQGFFGVFKTT